MFLKFYRFDYHWSMEDKSPHSLPVMLIPRYLYGTKKAVIGRCRTIMRHLFKHGELPRSFNADLIDAHSVEGQILMEMEMYQAVREHFHLYCLAEAFGEAKRPHWDEPEIYDPYRRHIAEVAFQFPWATLAFLCQGVMNGIKTPEQRKPLLEALLRHWPAIRSAEDKMIYEGLIFRNGVFVDDRGYNLSATAYWLRVTQGGYFWWELKKAGISEDVTKAWRSMEHSLDNIEDLIAEAIRLNQLKIDTNGPGQFS
jgi:hypothetical protein